MSMESIFRPLANKREKEKLEFRKGTVIALQSSSLSSSTTTNTKTHSGTIRTRATYSTRLFNSN